MADALHPIPALTAILSEHGPLSEDDLIQRLQQAGVADPDDALDYLVDEIGCAASQLIDDRWAWLPTLLAGRVFTHRLSADELAHDMLTVTPDLDPVTALCEDEQYVRFADGSPAYVALPMVDDELLGERETAPELVDPLGALLLTPGTLAALGVAEGDLVGVRLTERKLVIEPVTAIADAAVGARLAAMLDPENPVYFDAAVWTACAGDPELFTQPLAPLSEIADATGLSRNDDSLAPAGFDFDVWRFNLGCARLVRRYGIDPDEAFALHTLLELHDQMSLLLETADPDEPWDEPARTDVEDVAEGPDGGDLTGELGA
ncbi:MAG: hypothetical protein ACRDUX_17505, partial [Mycobacterium sp.]